MNEKTLKELRAANDRKIISQRMKKHSGNVSAVARSLQVKRDLVIKILSKK